MRFVELQLQAFGPFTDRVLDLSQGDYGLHVIYGPNEAGKSSALRAIRAALFGVPEKTLDNFRHAYEDLRVGAILRNDGGQELSFVRRKGRKKTLLNPNANLGSHPDDVLDAYLMGVDVATFEGVFGIDQNALRAGGKLLSQLHGLSGESLFAAGLGSISGGASLADVLKQLDDDASAIFHAGRGPRNTAVRLSLDEYKEITRRKTEASVSSHKWQQQQRDLETARNGLEQIRQRLSELRARDHRLQRLQNALPRIAEQQRLLEELAALGDVVPLPETYSVEARNRCQIELRQFEQRIIRLEEQLQQARDRADAITIPPGLLEHESLIAALSERLGAHTKAAKDVRHLRVERDLLRTQLEKVLRELGADDETELAGRSISGDRRVAIQNLANDEKQVRGTPAQLASDQRKLERAASGQQAELDQLGPAPDLAGLARAAAEARKLGDIEADLEQHRQELTNLENEAARQLRSLGLWTGTLVELAALPVPLLETVETFASDFGRADGELSLLTQRHTELDQEQADVRREIELLEQAEQVPTEEELARLRRRRDEGWSLIRAAWLDGRDDEPARAAFAKDKPLAEAFEESVSRADLMADRLRREAERVAHLAERRAKRNELEDRVARSNQQIEQARIQRADLERHWSQLWEPLQIRPRAPHEMGRWLEKQARLVDLERGIAEQLQKLRRVERRYQQGRDQLAQAFEQHGTLQPLDGPLCVLLDGADLYLRGEADKCERRKAAQRELARCRSELEELAERQHYAHARLETWRAAWQKAMREIGCPADAPADQANERLKNLQELALQIDRIAELDLRINAIDRDAREFAADVQAATSQLAPELNGAPAERAASELGARLARARTDKVRHDELLDQVHQQQAELEDLREQRTERQEQLTQLCDWAGAADPAALPHLEQASQATSRCRQRLAEIDEQLRELAGGASLEEFALEANSHDVDRLAVESQELKAEIETLDRQREEQAVRVSDLEAACRAADGSAAAADADQQALGILSRLHGHADRYLRLRLASSLLRHQIEKYRSENQDPLLMRASELFAQLTCGEFEGLRTEYDEKDQPVIVGVRRTGEVVHVAAMSEGTCDQLYLALRLGYLEHVLLRRESLPLVVDDILVNFDDGRAAATVQVLAELSRQTQVIFFTHHQHLVELATLHVRQDLFVHELAGRLSHPI